MHDEEDWTVNYCHGRDYREHWKFFKQRLHRRINFLFRKPGFFEIHTYFNTHHWIRMKIESFKSITSKAIPISVSLWKGVFHKQQLSYLHLFSVLVYEDDLLMASFRRRQSATSGPRQHRDSTSNDRGSLISVDSLLLPPSCSPSFRTLRSCLPACPFPTFVSFVLFFVQLLLHVNLCCSILDWSGVNLTLSRLSILAYKNDKAVGTFMVCH